MNAIKWHSKFETGNEQIDSEHKQLLCLIDACLESSSRGATREELIVQLNGIRDHVASHFKNEELITASKGKPHSNYHKMQHENLLVLIKTYISELGSGSNRKITAQEILMNLIDWYVHHIENEDKKLVSQ